MYVCINERRDSERASEREREGERERGRTQAPLRFHIITDKIKETLLNGMTLTPPVSTSQFTALALNNLPPPSPLPPPGRCPGPLIVALHC